MERESIVFYKSWFDAIKNLPGEVQREALMAIIEYGLYDETAEPTNPVTNALLIMAKAQLYANRIKYANHCKSIEIGKLGGRPKTSAKTKPKPIANSAETINDNVNDNDNDNDNENVNENRKKETLSSERAKKEGEPSSLTLDSDFIKFIEWLKSNAPFCSDPKNFPSQITEKEFLKLKAQYTGKEIADIISRLENRKDLRNRYTNLYKTVLNWAKKADER